MKKLLLGTSMLAAVAVAATAQADVPKITVGGVIDWQVGVMSDDQDANQRAHAFRNDTEINFNIDGKADNGLGYGAVIVLEADVTKDANAEGTNAAKTFIYMDGSWGRVELGSNVSAAEALSVDAASIARATGGIDGAFIYYINNGGSEDYIITPDSPLEYDMWVFNYGDEATQNTNKVNYFTPRWNGFQLGLAYAPNDVDSGQAITRSDARGTVAADDASARSRAEDIFYGAINYQGTWDQVGVEAAAGFEHGDAETAGYEDLMAWNVGAKLSYMGFSVAGSYGDWTDSLTLSTANLDNYDYWTLGGAYEWGAFGVSVTYMDSDYDTTTGTNEFDNISIGADYKLAPGLTPYAEISFFDADTQTATEDNNGHVFILGTMLNF